MLTPIPDQLGLAALAQVLFASPVQPSQHPSREAIRAAVVEQLRACQGDPAACVRLVAQEAGDHPELCAARMRWARRSVARAAREDQADLERLAAELRQRGLRAKLCTSAGKLPYLHVRNPETRALSKRVYAQADSFWCSWTERIAGCDDTRAAAAMLSRALVDYT